MFHGKSMSVKNLIWINKGETGGVASQKAAENSLKILQCPSGVRLQNFKASGTKIVKKEKIIKMKYRG